jgi:WD40 repeat protein
MTVVETVLERDAARTTDPPRLKTEPEAVRNVWTTLAAVLATSVVVTGFVALRMNAQARELEDKHASLDKMLNRARFVATHLEEGAFRAFPVDAEKARALGAAAYQAATGSKAAEQIVLDDEMRKTLALVMSSGSGARLNVSKVFWAQFDGGRIIPRDLPSGLATQLAFVDTNGRGVAGNDRAYVLTGRLYSASAFLFLPRRMFERLSEQATATGQTPPSPHPVADKNATEAKAEAAILAWQGPGQVVSVALSPESNAVVFMTTDGLVVKADFETLPPTLTLLSGAPASNLPAHRFFGADEATALDPTGRWAATYAKDVVTIREVSAAAHTWQVTLPVNDERRRAIWLAPTGRLAVSSGIRTVEVWDPPDQTAQPHPTPEGRPHGKAYLAGDPRYVAFSTDGRLMVTLLPEEIQLWNAENAEQVLLTSTFEASESHATGWRNLMFSEDGRHLGATGFNGVVARWNVEQPKVEFQRTFDQLPLALTFSPDARYLLLVDRSTARMIDFDQVCGDEPLESLAKHIRPPRPTEIESALEDGVPSLAEGVRAARDGKFDEAEKDLHDAEAWMAISLGPHIRQELVRLRIEALAAKAARSSLEGNVEGLRSEIDQLQGLREQPSGKQATAGDAELSDEAATELSAARKEMPLTLKLHGMHQIEADHYADAVADYRAAAQADPAVVAPSDWNWLCWEGAVHEKADDVLYACEEAVANAGEFAWQYRDSRGVARALLKNYQGAIDDLKFRVDHSPLYRERRLGWLKALREKKDPFTTDELKDLARE